ncbi:MAG TPA: amidohydrolase family protein [Puia sp.]|jgi:imidazolonepropionase-like amidohydrolase|nr:amidohydrolase family protein [Puia sp.]
MRNAFLFLLLASGHLLFAQTNDKYLIRAGRLFDSETGQFKDGMTILVNDNKIAAVKPANEVTKQEEKDYQLIDLSSYTVLPGLIDAHTHLLYKEIIYPQNEFDGLDLGRTLTMDGDAYRAIYGAARAKAYLEAGITSVQDLGNSGEFADIALRRAIREELVPGPRMRCSGKGLSSTGGQIPGLIFKHQSIVNDEYRIVKGPEDGIQAVRENITQGADVIKIYSNNTPNNTYLSIEEMKAIVGEAHRYHLRVTAHATSNQAVYNAVIAGVDGIEHGYQVEDSTLELMAKKGVVLVPTDGDSVSFIQYAKLASSGDPQPMIREIMAYRRAEGDRLQRAIRKGVTIVAGSDDYVDFKEPFAEPSKRTLIGYYESGVPIPQVLQFATINASRQLNWAGKIGVLKAGYWADIIAVDKDLEKNIDAILHVHFVMKGGKVVVQ